MLTRKTYELIAEAISMTKDYAGHGENGVDTLAYLVGNLRARLQNDNPRFDEERFKKACGF